MTDRMRTRSRDDDDRGSRRSRDDDRDERPARGSLREQAEPRRSRDDDDRGSRRSRDDDRGSRRGRDDDDRAPRRSSYEYKPRSTADTKARGSMGANDFDKIVRDDIKTFKPADGDNRIRILPPTWPDNKHFGYDIHVHYGVGPDRGQYLDLHKMQDKPDPIEEERVLAQREGDDKYAKDISSKRRVGIYLIDRNNEREGVQFWAAPWTFDRDLTKVTVDRATGEVLPIDHPDEGFDVEFTKQGSKDRTEYMGLAVARRSSPLGKDDWLDFAMDNPIPDILQYFDYDHIAKAFGGAGAQRDAHDSSRDADRERDAGHSRGRDADRDRDDRPAASSRDRDRDTGGDRSGMARDSGRGAGRDSRADTSQDQDISWESLHEMTMSELEDVIDQEGLSKDINPAEAKDAEDLADWICEELKLTKKAEATRRRSSDDDDSRDRMSSMRSRREG